MRELSWFGVAVMLAAVVNQAARAEGGRPSRETLREMGLGGLTIMSDAEAFAVRGHGFKGGHRMNGMNGGMRDSSAVATGNSFATFETPFGTSHSENQYAAEGKKFAFGKNHSEAGITLKIGIGGHKRPNGGNHGRMNGRPGGNHGGMNGRPGGGLHAVVTVKLFAGGHSFAAAH
jgi:hypothetical protein